MADKSKEPEDMTPQEIAQALVESPQMKWIAPNIVRMAKAYLDLLAKEARS